MTLLKYLLILGYIVFTVTMMSIEAETAKPLDLGFFVFSVETFGLLALESFWLYVVIPGAIFMYFYPSIVAYRRKTKNRMGILVFNLFLSWSFVAWVAALVWAYCDSVESNPSLVRMDNHTIQYDKEW